MHISLEATIAFQATFAGASTVELSSQMEVLPEPSLLPGGLHHVELYVSHLQTSLRFWEPLLRRLGYSEFQKWDQGVSYLHATTYIVLVQAETEHLDAGYHRKRVGLNHLAFHAASRDQVDEITMWVRNNGFTVLYEDKHPHAGGPDSYALYCEDPDRIKVEIVGAVCKSLRYSTEIDSLSDTPVSNRYGAVRYG